MGAAAIRPGEIAFVKQTRRTTVYLVGAGPGDPNLLTLAGLRCLRQADVIMYDQLVDPSILRERRPDCRLIYVGKQPGRHSLTQTEINRLLVRTSRQYRSVVRLKGGDPFMFGRGGEEALVLAEHHIPFEIIPGVSAGSAAAAYAGIPLTHREYASQVTFVTGHEDPSKQTGQVDWKLLARQPGTIVIFMGMARLATIVSQLITYGRDRQTLVCIVRYGTLPQQRTVTAPLQNIVAQAERAGITHPALVIIGAVVSLRPRLNWFETKPLFGRKFLVTRPESLAPELVKLLSEAGAQTMVYPLIEIVPEAVTPRAMMSGLAACEWVVFTSRNAVDQTFGLLQQAGADSRAFGGKKIAVLGTETCTVLAGYGIRADLMPKSFIMEELARCFRRLPMAGKRVLLPHSRQGRPLLRQALRQQGARVKEIFLYRVQRPATATVTGLARLLKNERFDGITFTSSSSVREFMELLSRQRGLVSQQKMISIGPVTSQTIFSHGFQPALTAPVFTASGLVEAMRKNFGAPAHD